VLKIQLNDKVVGLSELNKKEILVFCMLS